MAGAVAAVRLQPAAIPPGCRRCKYACRGLMLVRLRSLRWRVSHFPLTTASAVRRSIVYRRRFGSQEGHSFAVRGPVELLIVSWERRQRLRAATAAVRGYVCPCSHVWPSGERRLALESCNVALYRNSSRSKRDSRSISFPEYLRCLLAIRSVLCWKFVCRQIVVDKKLVDKHCKICWGTSAEIGNSVSVHLTRQYGWQAGMIFFALKLTLLII